MASIRQYIVCIFAALLVLGPLGVQPVSASNTVAVVTNSSNPNSLQVRVTTSDGSIDKIVVMSLVGRKMREQQFVKGQELYTFADITDFPNGIYIVVIKDRNDKILGTAKLVVNK